MCRLTPHEVRPLRIGAASGLTDGDWSIPLTLCIRSATGRRPHDAEFRGCLGKPARPARVPALRKKKSRTPRPRLVRHGMAWNRLPVRALGQQDRGGGESAMTAPISSGPRRAAPGAGGGTSGHAGLLRRVLVAEDDALVALAIADVLTGAARAGAAQALYRTGNDRRRPERGAPTRPAGPAVGPTGGMRGQARLRNAGKKTSGATRPVPELGGAVTDRSFPKMPPAGKFGGGRFKFPAG